MNVKILPGFIDISQNVEVNRQSLYVNLALTLHIDIDGAAFWHKFLPLMRMIGDQFDSEVV